jgi:hypothetical protein
MPSIAVRVTDANNITARVTPLPSNVITLNRGIVGPPGVPGEANIGGYPIDLSICHNYDALMWLDGKWTNVPQTEITDGGNF